MQQKRQLTPSELWYLSAEGLHTDEYIRKYVDGLEFAIRNRDLRILDTACGTGFPIAPLFERGFRNIAASDVDMMAVDRLSKFFSDKNVPVTVFHSMWHELDVKISEKFDVVVNADNSFVYMDGWEIDSEFSKENFKVGKEHAFDRAKLVLKNYYNLLNEKGMAIVGLGKHYEPALASGHYERVLGSFGLKPVQVGGENVDIQWFGDMNWETRVHDWHTMITGENIEGQVLRKSYLYTKYELADLMKAVGFQAVHIVDPDGTRDNLIVGIK